MSPAWIPHEEAVRKRDRPLLFLDLLGLGAAMGSLLGTDATTGGYVLGAIVLAVLVTIGLILTSKLRSGNMYGMIAFLSIGIAIPAMFGWFPDWFLVFVLMLVIGAGIAMSGATRSG